MAAVSSSRELRLSGTGPWDRSRPRVSSRPRESSRPRRRSAAVVVASVVASAVLVACGGSSKLSGPPPAVLTQALDGLGRLNAVQATVRLQIPASALGGLKVSAAESQALLATTVVVTLSTPDGRPLSEEGSSAHPSFDTDLALVTNDENLAEIRVVDHKIYARVDLPGLGTQLALPDADRSALAHAQSELQQEGTKAVGLANLAAGQWVDLPTSQVVSVGTQELSRQGTPLDSTSLRPATLGRIIGSVLSVVRGSTVVDTGATPGGEAYRATLPLRDLVSTPLTTAAALAGTFGTSATAERVIGSAEAIPPAATGQVDFVVSGSRITQAALPLGQLAPNDASARASQVVATFAPGATIGPPSPSTALDLVQLLSGLDQGVGGV